jgi:preprotein translocase subunit SecD
MMAVMYKSDIRYAIISLLAIASYLVILGGLIKIMDYALSLSGIAAIILSIGMGIDACILIFERMKEELAKGKPVQQSITDGQSRSRVAIFDGNMST